MKVNWQGVYPALTTKFTDDDKLDLKMFQKNMEAQLAAGINGVVLGGTLGEASSLHEEEKFDLVQFAQDLCKDKIPVILNIAEQSTKEAVRIAENAQKKGADGLMLLPPMCYKADDCETVTYFKAIAQATDLPIMIYNNPVDYKIEITLDMFDKLQKYSNITAVKESSRDITNVTRMRNRMLSGADGWVGGLVCAFPAETVAIYKLVKVGRINEALIINRWFMPLLELDIHPKLVQNIKLAEVYTGLGTENVRAPRLPLHGTEREKVIGIIETSLMNRPALPQL